MCWEDIKIGRQTRMTQNRVQINSVGGGFKLVVPHNSNRISLFIGNWQHQGFDLSINQNAVHGILITGERPWIKFNLVEDGCMVFGPWYAFADNVGIDLTVIEVFLEGKES